MILQDHAARMQHDTLFEPVPGGCIVLGMSTVAAEQRPTGCVDLLDFNFTTTFFSVSAAVQSRSLRRNSSLALKKSTSVWIVGVPGVSHTTASASPQWSARPRPAAGSR